MRDKETYEKKGGGSWRWRNLTFFRVWW